MKIEYDELEDIKGIKSIDDILKIKEAFEEVHKNVSDYTYIPFYRGQSNKNWKLEPSILRKKELSEYNLLKDHINSEFINDSNVSLFSKVAHAQHYNTPTRFLDFTKDILIATYFACAGQYEHDGAIYLCDYGVIRPDWIYTIAICEMCILQKPTSIHDFATYIMKKYKNIFLKYEDLCIENLEMNIMSFADHGFALFPSDKDYDELKIKNPRIYKQKGGFFVCGNKFKNIISERDRWFSSSGKNIMLPEINDIPYDSIFNNQYRKRIVINKSCKKLLLEQLEEDFNITENHLMCENDNDKHFKAPF